MDNKSLMLYKSYDKYNCSSLRPATQKQARYHAHRRQSAKMCVRLALESGAANCHCWCRRKHFVFYLKRHNLFQIYLKISSNDVSKKESLKIFELRTIGESINQVIIKGKRCKNVIFKSIKKMRPDFFFESLKQDKNGLKTQKMTQKEAQFCRNAFIWFMHFTFRGRTTHRGLARSTKSVQILQKIKLQKIILFWRFLVRKDLSKK